MNKKNKIETGKKAVFKPLQRNQIDFLKALKKAHKESKIKSLLRRLENNIGITLK